MIKEKTLTVWATQRFYATIRGIDTTHELWLPLDMNNEDLAQVINGLRKMVDDLERNRNQN